MATPKNLLIMSLLGFAVAVPAPVLTAQIVVEHKAVAAEGGAEFKVLPAGSPDAPPAAFGPGPFGPQPVMPEKPGAEKGEPGEGKDQEKDKAKAQEDKPGEGKEKPEQKEKPDEAPKPLSRPTEPSKPGDPEELKIRPDDDGKIKFNFTGQKWPDVLQWLADISEMSLDWQELPGDFLNMTTQRSYTVEEARDLINRHLLDRGYTMLCQGELMSVVNTKKLNPSMVPRVDPAELEQRRPYEFVKVSFRLDWLVAPAAVKELEPMLSPNGKLTALSATNRLEAMDAAINLREIYRLLTQEQSPDGKDRLVQVFELHHSRAEDVRKQLLELLGAESKASGFPGPMTPEQMQQMQEQAKRMAEMQKQQGGKSPVVPSKPKTDVNLVVNERKNSILAYAPPDKMAVIEQAIQAIDVPSDHAHSLLRNKDRMQVYRLENLDPEPLIKTLQELGDLDFDTRLEADQQNNAIVAYASLADHLTIHALIAKLDGGGRHAEVIQLSELRAASVAQTIDFMMGGGKKEEQESDDNSRDRRVMFSLFGGYDRDSSRRRSRSEDHADAFRVDADVKNNRLLLWCNEFELAKVEQLLDHLRQMPDPGREPNTAKVYHLVTLDPEPFVKTLEEMETLDFCARLQVDQENSAIIAYGSEADHAKIRDLITKLDGSSRAFHVIPLKRLEADYVAGTIEFMMAGKEEGRQSGYSRTYVYNEYYGSGPSRGGKDKKPDEFRIDADVEYNRLLLWANEMELEEVKNLLVKLGELPSEGGDSSTIRVLDVSPGPDREKLLEHIRRIWPSLAPNPLLTPQREESDKEPEESDKEKKEADPKESEDKVTSAESRPNTAANGLVPRGMHDADRPDSAAVRVGDGRTDCQSVLPRPSVFRLAQLQRENSPPETPPKAEREPAPSGPSDSEPAESSPPPEQPSSNPAPGDPAGKPAPVSITQAPDGRLIITSQDTRALDQLEELLTRLTPPRKDYEVFQLRYAWAYSVRSTLEEFFQEEEKRTRSWSPWWDDDRRSSEEQGPRLSKRRPLKFLSDSDTNTLLVQGADPAQLKTIEELIKIYDQPEPPDSQSVRKTEIFQIRYSQAGVIAEAVKEVYRDLLSTRDKALSKEQQNQRPESRYTWYYRSDEDSTELQKPKFKGLLSMGIDELSNTLIVSAPPFLFTEIGKLVEQLDEAARPTASSVRVVKMGSGVTASSVQQVLAEVLGQSTTNRRPAARGGTRPPGPGEPRPPHSHGDRNNQRN